MGRFAAAALLVSAIQCDGSDVSWVRFNDLDDVLEVQVTSDAAPGPPVSTDLHSTTGAVVVGVAAVDPGSGPVGTRHVLTVDVRDPWKDVVDRVSVRADAGPRGTEEFELIRDSADHGHWVVELESAGEPGEVRTDTFTVLLWQASDARPVDTGA